MNACSSSHGKAGTRNRAIQNEKKELRLRRGGQADSSRMSRKDRNFITARRRHAYGSLRSRLKAELLVTREAFPI